jgi:hypothetical protein
MTNYSTAVQYAINTNSGAAAFIDWPTNPGHFIFNAGTATNVGGATIGQWHALFGEANGANSYAQNGGVANLVGPVAGGANGTGAKWGLCGVPAGGGSPCSANIAEAFIISAADQASWNAIQLNQNSYWGLQ